MNKRIFVTQEGYAKKLVDMFGLKQSKTCSTPLQISTRLRRDKGSFLADPTPFRAFVGSLLYFTITRPDIAFSMGYVSRSMQRPRKPHLEAAKRILKYINSISDMGLFFKKKKKNLVLAGYTDADFGGDLDDRRSTSGYIFLCGGTSISWCSKKQNSVFSYLELGLQ
ncbi:secreted RxLR effector protein 161-like [Nicotiana tabacum]|uniref:Secreted RxLR effector protein 161-like n=1 Tax=Nicotiana tabacum TaxID=4097 RepID=A0AC58RU88_TOBAC